MYSAPNLLSVATLLPLASALLLLCMGSKLGRASAYIALGSILAALALSVATLVLWVAKPQFNQAHYVEAVTFRWLPVTDPMQIRMPEGLIPMETALARTWQRQEIARRAQGLQFGVLVDSLTIIMFLAVTTIAAFVYLFAIALMADIPRFARFLAYLDLMCFSMLGLALSDNLVQMLAFLELLAISGWLLIGFSRQRRAVIHAAGKSIIFQSLGTAAFIAGAGILVAQSAVGMSGLTLFAQGPDLVGMPVLEHQALVAALGAAPAYSVFLGLSWLTWAGICIFIGAMAISAQFPLHAWFTDAVSAPMPALALMGSITSLAAGAFVVARLFGILTLDARLFIAVIGAISFAGGALIAMVQTDIKRLLAFSSISHLGLVMLFFGVGAYVAALFVLLTHAFSKSCLFLSAGSVIHGCRGETRIGRMGGLWKPLPITAGTFMLAMLSLCGTPWLSGFFGQEMGLSLVHRYAYALPSHYGPLLWWIPFITMFLVALYMWRCWWLIFGGAPRDLELYETAHENPLMTLVLILLAGLTVVSAYLEIDRIAAKSVPVMSMVLSAPRPDPLAAIQTLLGWSSVLAALFIMLVYAQGLAKADRLRRLPIVNLFYRWLAQELYLDQLYDGVVVQSVRLIAALCSLIDRRLIDGFVRLLAWSTLILGTLVTELDTRVFDAPVGGLVHGLRGAWRFVKHPASTSSREAP